jgi:hypothetical protein
MNIFVSHLNNCLIHVVVIPSLPIEVDVYNRFLVLGKTKEKLLLKQENCNAADI